VWWLVSRKPSEKIVSIAKCRNVVAIC